MNMWQAAKAVIDKSRPAYKDYLGTEEVDKLVMHGTIESGSSSAQMTMDDSSFKALKEGEVYSVSVNGGEPEEHTAYLFEAENIVILSSTDGVQGEAIGMCKWLIAAMNDDFGVFRYSDTDSAMSIRVTRRVKQAKYDIKRLDEELLPKSVSRDIKAAKSVGVKAQAMADKAINAANNAYGLASRAENVANNAYKATSTAFIRKTLMYDGWDTSITGLFTDEQKTILTPYNFPAAAEGWYSISFTLSNVSVRDHNGNTWVGRDGTIKTVVCAPDDDLIIRLPTIRIEDTYLRKLFSVEISGMYFEVEDGKYEFGKALRGASFMEHIKNTSDNGNTITEAEVRINIARMIPTAFPQTGDSISLPSELERGTIAALPKTDDQTQSIGVDSDGFLWTAAAPEYLPDLTDQTLTATDGTAYRVQALPSGSVYLIPETNPNEITDSWEEIVAALDDGTYKTKYSVHQTKRLDLGAEGMIEMEIVGIDVDDIAADGATTGEKAKLSMIAKTGLATGMRMNPPISGNATNGYADGTGTIGGFLKSNMYRYLTGKIKPLFPANVKARLATVAKSYYEFDTTGTRSQIFAYGLELWLPSWYEMAQSGGLYNDAFSTDTSRAKGQFGRTGNKTYWTRDAGGKVDSFIAASPYGSDFYPLADIEKSVVIGFCLN